jgi:hypothetical protein
MKKNKKRKEHKRNLPGAQTTIHVVWACASSHPVPVVPPSYLPSLPSPVRYSLSCGPGLVVGPCHRLPPHRHCCGRSSSSARPCLAVAMGGGAACRPIVVVLPAPSPRCPCTRCSQFSSRRCFGKLRLQWSSASPIVVVLPVVPSLPSPPSRHSRRCSPFSPREQLLAAVLRGAPVVCVCGRWQVEV